MVGAITGTATDYFTQIANGNEFSVGEFIGATVGGAAGGFITGGALAPIAGVAVRDAVSISAASAAGAQIAFASALSGWALGQMGHIAQGHSTKPVSTR